MIFLKLHCFIYAVDSTVRIQESISKRFKCAQAFGVSVPVPGLCLILSTWLNVLISKEGPKLISVQIKGLHS